MHYVCFEVKLQRSEDGNCCAVLDVTATMRRMKQLDSEREIIFVDWTSPCDSMHSTVTMMLAATKAGAIAIAVLIHNSKSAQGYTAAFSLLKETYQLCFGGLTVFLVTVTRLLMPGLAITSLDPSSNCTFLPGNGEAGTVPPPLRYRSDAVACTVARPLLPHFTLDSPIEVNITTTSTYISRTVTGVSLWAWQL
ncbi:uncharacterized protein LOC142776645 isoform X2 [Rhipicephalus microplus]|uniref:uncharacterized protein LOC142776645 isoform X2 n=1 Tax=Rhipicephalus microplus TaxID=6941 RepID=UPI003F6C4736